MSKNLIQTHFWINWRSVVCPGMKKQVWTLNYKINSIWKKNQSLARHIFKTLDLVFWGIIGKDGKKWKPINMPEQLKQEGKSVKITARIEEDSFSIEMWGTTIQILSFET